jgi:hypothetical protein
VSGALVTVESPLPDDLGAYFEALPSQ